MICQVSERTIIRAEVKANAIDLLGGKCVQCDSTERLEFDHIKNDRRDNYHCIAAFVDSKWSRVLVELQKCQLLCKTCHVKKSLAARGFDITKKHGRSLYVTAKCRCDICREDRKVAQQQYRRKLVLEVIH